MPRCLRYEGGLVLPRCGPAKKAADSEDGFCSEGDSSANEYAEGLGCADQKRCREKPASGFEFDNVPREEYFQEPRSHAASAQSDEEEAGPPALKRRHLPSLELGQPLSAVLAQLERAEESSEGPAAEERLKLRKQRCAALARRCEYRSARRSHPAAWAQTPGRGAEERAAGPARPQRQRASSAAPAAAAAAPQRGGGAAEAAAPAPAGAQAGFVSQLLRYRGLLSQARERVALGIVEPAETVRTLQMLRKLAAQSLDASVLKATGLGLELNHKVWRQHPQQRVVEAAGGLVSKWRAAVRVQQQRVQPQAGVQHKAQAQESPAAGGA